jgi:hypothetical protein
VRQQCLIGETGEAVFRRGASHRHHALGQRIDAVRPDVVGRHDRLLLPHQNAQPHVVAFGALRFLHRAVAHFDRKRHAAHGNGVGRIGAGAPRGSNEAFGKIGQGRLVKQRGHYGTL